MFSVPKTAFSAGMQAIALAAGLYPVVLLGRLVNTIAVNQEMDALLQRFPVYATIESWMNGLAAKSSAGFAALLLFGIICWLAFFGNANRRDALALRESTRIPRLVLGLAIPPVLSLFAFVGGVHWGDEKSMGIFVVLLAVGFVTYFVIHACDVKGAATAG